MGVADGCRGRDKAHPSFSSFPFLRLYEPHGHLSFAQTYLGCTRFINKKEGRSPAAPCLRLRAWGGMNAVWGAFQCEDTRRKGQRGRESVCVCACVWTREGERGREEVTSPGFVLGSYLRLEPVVAIQMQEGWGGCFWFSRKHAIASPCAVVVLAGFSCCFDSFQHLDFH